MGLEGCGMHSVQLHDKHLFNVSRLKSSTSRNSSVTLKAVEQDIKLCTYMNHHWARFSILDILAKSFILWLRVNKAYIPYHKPKDQLYSMVINSSFECTSSMLRLIFQCC